MLQEILVHRLDGDVETERASIHFHERVRDARSRQATIAKHLRGDQLGEISAILAGVVEHEFAQAKIILVRRELVELHREARLFVERPEAAHALEVDADVLEGVRPFRDRRSHVATIILLKDSEPRLAHGDLESSDAPIGKEVMRRRRFRGGNHSSRPD